jgi:hypothetical protein
MNSWLFQGNPKNYQVRAALHHFKSTSQTTTWLVNAHSKEILEGDEVYFWEAGPLAGLVGWGTVVTDPLMVGLERGEELFVVTKAKFDGLRLRVRIRVEGECYCPRSELKGQPPFSNWYPVARGQEGTNFRIPADVLPELRRIAREGHSPLP